mmetsp:Transcript_33188/g.67760  ORF Transcript_33188/g.67760 Transcript_33188/m.67760 type:complete len:119 (+) Transcript_33188:401-757(+)
MCRGKGWDRHGAGDAVSHWGEGLNVGQCEGRDTPFVFHGGHPAQRVTVLLDWSAKREAQDWRCRYRRSKCDPPSLVERGCQQQQGGRRHAADLTGLASSARAAAATSRRVRCSTETTR